MLLYEIIFKTFYECVITDTQPGKVENKVNIDGLVKSPEKLF